MKIPVKLIHYLVPPRGGRTPRPAGGFDPSRRRFLGRAIALPAVTMLAGSVVTGDGASSMSWRAKTAIPGQDVVLAVDLTKAAADVHATLVVSRRVDGAPAVTRSYPVSMSPGVHHVVVSTVYDTDGFRGHYEEVDAALVDGDGHPLAATDEPLVVAVTTYRFGC